MELSGFRAAGGCARCMFRRQPTYPSPDTVWSISAEQRVTLLGTSPSHLRASAAAGLRPDHAHDLSALRSIGSSGSILPAAAYHYVAEHVGSRIRLNSTTGGTDIVSSFAGSGPTTAVWPGYLSAPSLGVALDSWDAAGRSVRNEVGELVVTAPMPSMPIRFWGTTTEAVIAVPISILTRECGAMVTGSPSPTITP
jgi:acetoacetyl-CoA synthetase